MSDFNVKTILAIYEAFGRGDTAAVAAKCADDTHWDFNVQPDDVPWHAPVRGKGDVPRFFGALAESVVFHAFEPRAFIHSDEHVIAHIHISYDVRRTGRKVTMDQLHWWSLRDGKVTRLRHFEDTAQVLAAWQG